MDLPTLGTSLKQIPSESATQEAQNLADLRDPGPTVRMTGQTFREAWVDRPRDCGRLSEISPRTTSSTP
jgi:hypothetical protein